MRLAMIMMALALFVCPSIGAQEVPPDSTITMSGEQYNQLRADIQALLESDSIHLEIIKQQDLQITQLNQIIVQDSMLVSFKDFRIGLLEDEIGLYKDKVDDLADTSWKNSKGVWASIGAAGMVLASWIIKNVGGG